MRQAPHSESHGSDGRSSLGVSRELRTSTSVWHGSISSWTTWDMELRATARPMDQRFRTGTQGGSRETHIMGGPQSHSKRNLRELRPQPRITPSFPGGSVEGESTAGCYGNGFLRNDHARKSGACQPSAVHDGPKSALEPRSSGDVALRSTTAPEWVITGPRGTGGAGPAGYLHGPPSDRGSWAVPDRSGALFPVHLVQPLSERYRR